MAKYLIKSSFTTEGLKGLIKDGGTARRKAVDQMVQGLGGRVEAMYWALGEEDVYVTVELPDNVSAAAEGIVTSAGGGVRTNTVVLLTAEEIDQAVRKQVNYSPPGA